MNSVADDPLRGTVRLRLAVSKKPIMSDESNIEDVAQQQNEPKREALRGLENHGIGDADTAEGQARRAEEAHFGGDEGWDAPEVEDLDELPTSDEAELGELCRVEGWDTPEVEDLDELPTPDEAELGELCSPKGASDEEVKEAIEAVEDRIDAAKSFTGGEL